MLDDEGGSSGVIRPRPRILEPNGTAAATAVRQHRSKRTSVGDRLPPSEQPMSVIARDSDLRRPRAVTKPSEEYAAGRSGQEGDSVKSEGGKQVRHCRTPEGRTLSRELRQ